MCDLAGQYRRLQGEIDEAISRVLTGGVYIGGEEVSQLEAELCRYTGAEACVTCGNGTDALVLAMRALEIGEGDEVIVPDFTFAAPAEAAAIVGAKVVFADVLPDTMTIDPEQVRRLITPQTKAIVAVHLFGQCCDMESLGAIASQHHLYLIEDGAQALGAEYAYRNGQTKQALTMGMVGCTSFFPTKNLGCYGDGGAVMTNDEELAARVRQLAHHGCKTKYHHELIGMNSRLDALQAAVLRVKLRHLDEDLAARKAAAERYDTLLAGIDGIVLPTRGEQRTHTFHQYVIKVESSVKCKVESVKSRDLLRAKLAEAGIPTMVYYPEPLHEQPAFGKVEKLKVEKLNPFPVATRLTQTVLALPMHTELTIEQQTQIACQLSDLI